MKKIQYWLAELDIHGNPTLVDGAHTSRVGCNKAAYLIKAMGLGKPNRNFAIARIELSECKPSDRGVNHEAVASVIKMKAAKFKL